MLTKDIDKYLSWKRSNYERAAEAYEIHLRRLNDFYRKSLSDIQIEDIVAFQNSLKNKYSPSHVWYTMTVIKDFIGFFYRKRNKNGKRLCYLDPTLIKIKEVAANHHYAVSENDYYAMLKLMPENNVWEAQRKIVIRMLFETGARVSELVNLNVEDVSNRDRSALIATKKGIEKGWIVWSEDMHDLLIKFLGVRLCMNMDHNLFITKNGTRPTTRTIERWVKAAAKTAGIEQNVVPHGFRHGKIHYMIEREAPEVALVRALRHSERGRSSVYPYASLNQAETKRLLDPYLPSTSRKEKDPAIITLQIPMRAKPVYSRVK